MHSVAYGRDENGNLTSATDALSSGNSAFDTSISYDLLNRPTHVAEPFGVTLDYQYDAADNRTQVVDNKGGQTDSTYDDLNRLTTMTLSGSGVTGTRTTWGYDSAGDMAGITKETASGSGWAASGSTNYHYDDLGRNDAITQKNGAGTTVGAYTFTLDLADRLTASKYVTGSVTSSHSFGYDDSNRLKSADGVNYTYDKAGNPTGTGYTLGVANRMTSDGVWTYTYDDAGQMTGKSKSGEAWSYTYDYNGQMVSASKSATVGGTVTDSVAYTFDAFGNRLSRVQSGSTSKTERFAYDGADAFLDLDGSNAVTTRRQYGPGVDNLLSRQSGGSVEWYGTDAQGSVRQVFDNTGNQTSWADYEAHGALVGGGTLTDRYGFTGREKDALTGQQYNRARVLDGQSWTSEDPMGFAAGDANLRRYVGNGPTNGTDPSGNYVSFEVGRSADNFERLLSGGGVRWSAYTNSSGNSRFFWIHPDDKQKLVEALRKIGWSDGDIGYILAAAFYNPSELHTRFSGDIYGQYYRTESFDPEANIAEKLYGLYKIYKVKPPTEQRTSRLTFKEATDIAADAYGKASVVILNELTFNQIDSLNDEANVIIKTDPTFATSKVCGGIAREALVTAAGGGAFTRIAGKLGQVVGNRIVITSCAIKTAAKVTAAVGKLVLTANQVAQVGKKIDAAWDAYEKGDNQALYKALGEAGIDIASLGFDIADIARMAKALGRDGFKKLFTSCFAAGTPVWTARGWVSIEHIRVGDWVWTRSESSPFEPVRLGQVGIVVRRSAPILEVRFDGGRVLRTTSEHPFWAAGRGWVSAGELSAGDVLAGREGEWTLVAAVVPTAAYEAVYNFHVPGDQTYFVGGANWPAAVWAHNTGADDCLNGAGKQPAAPAIPRQRVIIDQIKDLDKKLKSLQKDAQEARRIFGPGADDGIVAEIEAIRRAQLDLLRELQTLPASGNLFGAGRTPMPPNPPKFPNDP